MLIRNYSLSVLFLLVLASCSITEHIGEMQLEVMRPGLLNIPEHADTIAVLYDQSGAKDSTFAFFDGRKLINYSVTNFDALFAACTDTLYANLGKTSYFRKIYYYADSLDLTRDDDKVYVDYLFRRTKSDVCIVLRRIDFERGIIMNDQNMSMIPVQLRWTILFRNDTTAYFYHQADTLTYDSPVISALVKNNNAEQLLKNAVEYLGKSCAEKLIPGWIPVERMYYRSGNPEMRKAEKFARQNDWISAAEIWNKNSKSPNEKIAAKAAFNMGLACEMEGKPDLAIDWVVQSANKKSFVDNEIHRKNCQRYIIILNRRKKDIEKLNRQIRFEEN